MAERIKELATEPGTLSQSPGFTGGRRELIPAIVLLSAYHTGHTHTHNMTGGLS